MARKTFSVADLRDRTNTALRLSWERTQAPDADLTAPTNTAAFRIGLYLTLEGVLMETGNNKGFRYLDTAHMVHAESDNTARHYH